MRVSGERNRLERFPHLMLTHEGPISCARQKCRRHCPCRLKSLFPLPVAAFSVLLAAACSDAETLLCPTGSDPDSGGQVEPGTVEDCEILLSFRDSLAGDASLNWQEATPVGDWEGVEFDASTLPARVTEIALLEKGMNGKVPPAQGGLSLLRTLDNSWNALTGELHAGLDRFTQLGELRLVGNQLTGCLPQARQEIEVNDIAETGLPFCS